MSEIVERVAKAMFRSLDADPRFVGRADLSPEHPGWAEYIHQAAAAIEAHKAALAEAGFVIVPQEPTDAMIDAGAAVAGRKVIFESVQHETRLRALGAP